jgi:hypothetical protein
VQGGQLKCGDYNANQLIEKSAEVFAAEFIFPEVEFLARTQEIGIQRMLCSPEDVVKLKRSCNACVSYTFLRKRLVRLGYAEEATFAKVKFTKLEESMFGSPYISRIGSVLGARRNLVRDPPMNSQSSLAQRQESSSGFGLMGISMSGQSPNHSLK